MTKSDICDLIAGKRVFSEHEEVLNEYKKKKVLVTGACGSLGSVLFKKLHEIGAEVYGIDSDENAVAKNPHIMLGDFSWIPMAPYSYVFHTAAYKHVKLGEMKNNIYAFTQNNVSRVVSTLKGMSSLKNPPIFVMASTDKAAGRSVMGRTKRLAEIEVGRFKQRAVRLVNIVGSRGSVLDIWRKSLSGEVFICPDHVYRYWMQADDAAYAMLCAGVQKPGLFSVYGVPKVTMGELRDAFVETYGDKKKYSFRRVMLAQGESEEEHLIAPMEKLVEIGSPVLKEIR